MILAFSVATIMEICKLGAFYPRKIWVSGAFGTSMSILLSVLNFSALKGNIAPLLVHS